MLQLVLAAIGLCGGAAFVRLFVPYPVEYGLQAKWEHFSEHKDEYDAVFIGTSRLFRGTDTVLIRRELAERGIEMRSFNFGVAGMRAFEQDFLLRRVLDLRPARLKWVFMEGGPWSPRFTHPHLTYSSRSVFYHTSKETLRLLDAVRRMDGSWIEKAKLAATHANLFLWKLTSYGQGCTITQYHLRQGEDLQRYQATLQWMEDHDGFQSAFQHTGLEYMPGREELLRDTGPYQRQVAAIEAETADLPPLDGVSLLGIRDQHRLAREHGVELVVVVQPAYEGAAVRQLLYSEGEIEHLLDFNQPSKYPELFDLENRYDERHLNHRGAVVFSKLLAETIATKLFGVSE